MKIFSTFTRMSGGICFGMGFGHVIQNLTQNAAIILLVIGFILVLFTPSIEAMENKKDDKNENTKG